MYNGLICFIILKWLNVSVDKMDQVISIHLNKLAREDMERLALAGILKLL